MAEYTSTHTGAQLDSVVTDVLDKSATWSAKQEALISGTNIKTINNSSILGSGNLSLGGGKVDDVQVDGVSVVTNKIANIDSSNFGKVDDVKANGTSLVVDKEVNLIFNTTYDASTNKIATATDITNAIGSAIEGSY